MNQSDRNRFSDQVPQSSADRTPALPTWIKVTGVLLILAVSMTAGLLIFQSGRSSRPLIISPATPSPHPSGTPVPHLNSQPAIPLDAPNSLWLPDPADIPTGLHLQTQNLASTNMDVAAQYPSATATAISQLLELSGRLTGQYRDYLNTALCSTTSGIYELTVQAVLHTSFGGAISALGLDVQYASVLGIGEIAGVRLMDLQVACTPPITLRAVSLAFQRANVRAYVDITAIPGSMSDSDLETLALHLAGIMDARIQSDLR